MPTMTNSTYPNLRKNILGNLTKLSTASPETMRSFASLHKNALLDGALNNKTKELIALAIAVASQCDGCVAFHTHDALNAGATSEEITDALGVAVLMGGGPAMVYATHAVEAMEQFIQNSDVASKANG